MIAEQSESFPGRLGLTLEGVLTIPAAARAGAVVCHPHPLYGGDMDNPVVTAVARACADAGVATLRFNFRGVGGSGGVWDEGRGEQDDVRAALARLRALLPASAPLALAGYSFGASMSAAVASSGEPLGGLALIAPPLGMRPWDPADPLSVDGPILLLAGGEDGYCPREMLTALGRRLPTAAVTILDGVDHFFFTGLERLVDAVGGWARALG